MASKLRRFLKWTVLTVAGIFVLAALGLFVAYRMSDNDCAELAAAPVRDPMKAIVYCDYGGPETLRLQEIEKPVPADGRVLVKVRAASTNPLDWHYMRGTPYIMRLEAGLRKPKVTRLGVDFAGTVEAVGKDVMRFKPGDEVFGPRTGAFGEYVSVREEMLVMKPENVTFEQAAAVPVAGLTALQALRDKGKVQPGQKVLINGASGGVGTFAVQIAKSLGAHVTGVCSTRNVELVRSLGADHVIDYTRQNYITAGQKYDVVIDMVGNHPVSAHRNVLQPNGIYVIVGGPSGRWIAPMDRIASATVVSWLAPQEFVMFLSKLDQKDLAVLRDLMTTGQITPVIDRTYPLRAVPEAIRYLETGRARGKVVITMDGE